MDKLNLSESEIKDIVTAVMTEISQAAKSADPVPRAKQFDFGKHPGVVLGGASTAQTDGALAQPTLAKGQNTTSALPDLGDNTVGRIVGVSGPHNQDVLDDFVASSRSRVASGRAGARPRTIALLRFLADHSRSKDTVLKNVPQSWVEKSGLLELHTEIIDKDQFLTRPDLGRKLSQDSIEKALKECKPGPEVQLIVSDGLSTDAVVVNFEEIIPPLLKGLENAGMADRKSVV